MKKINIIGRGLLILALVLCASTLGASNASASNIYGINYAGGEELSAENVQIEPEFLDSLTPLITRKNTGGIVISQNSDFRIGYYKNTSNNTCHEFYYYPITANEARGDAAAEEPNLSYTVSSDEYTASVNFENIVYEQLDPETQTPTFTANDASKAIAVGVHSTNRYVYVSAGVPIYTDETCATRNDSIKTITRGEERVFAQVKVKLFEKESGEPFSSNGLYISITDIDAAQSYKILNKQDILTAGKMYSKSASNLQPINEEKEDKKSPVDGLKNMFVSEGGYIYSEYTDDETITTDEKNDIFVKLSSATQAEGLDFVFGFAGSAGSGIEYYADFTQDNEPEKDEEAKQPVAVPNTGTTTGETNATQVVISVIAVVVVALAIAILPRMFHKKIDFKK